MTTRQALKEVQTVLMCYIADHPKVDAVTWGHVKRVDEAWKIIRRLALEAENSPYHERNTPSWDNVPCESEKTETERLAKRTLNMVEELWDKLTVLQGKVCQLEKTITYHDVIIKEIEREGK